MNCWESDSSSDVRGSSIQQLKPIFFHKSGISSSNSSLEPFQNEGMPQLSLYSPMAQAIMKKMGYDAQNPIGLGGGRGIITPLEPTLTKSQLEGWKPHRHIEKSSHGLGYDPDAPLRQLTQRLQSHLANQASTSLINEDIDLPGYLFEESSVEDSGSPICCLTTTRHNRFDKSSTSVTSPTSSEVKTFVQMPWLDLLRLWQTKKDRKSVV